jgi:hypothetical protein
MQWSDIPWRPPATTLRWFAGLWILWFLGLAGTLWFLRDNRVAAIISFAIGIVVGIAGLFSPRMIRIVFVGSMVLSFPLGWLVSRLLLGVIFYCLFSPIALFFKLIGRDALARRFQPKLGSYWSAKPEPTNIRQYFHQS